MKYVNESKKKNTANGSITTQVNSYSGNKGIGATHRNLKITSKEFDTFMQFYRESLSECGVQASDAAIIVAKLTSWKDIVVHSDNNDD